MSEEELQEIEDSLLEEFGTTNRVSIAYKIAIDINENGDNSEYCLDDIVGFLGEYLCH